VKRLLPEGEFRNMTDGDTQQSAPAIEFRDVTKVFGSDDTVVRAVSNLSFVCPGGSFWAIMGPSGSGKSTVLHLIAGLTSPTSGSVLIERTDVARMTDVEAAALRRRRIGYVLQAFNLLPFLTAAENVGMPLVLDGVKQSEVDVRVEEALSMVKMAHRSQHRPAHLSGGEQQRVAIARALVIRPAIVLADEPTGNLDRAGGRAIMDLILDINERTGVTILLVTHDPVFAAYAKRVLRIVDGSLQQEMTLGDDDAADDHFENLG
jgi:putative ABC transport system ATP-binding protein